MHKTCANYEVIFMTDKARACIKLNTPEKKQVLTLEALAVFRRKKISKQVPKHSELRVLQTVQHQLNLHKMFPALSKYGTV